MPTQACLQNAVFLQKWTELQALFQDLSEQEAQATDTTATPQTDMHVDEGAAAAPDISALAEQVLAETPDGQSEEQTLAVKRALEQLQAKAKKAKTSIGGAPGPTGLVAASDGADGRQQRG